MQQVKAEKPAPRKEPTEKPQGVLDRAALVARLPSDSPVADAVLDAVEAILKEQAVRPHCSSPSQPFVPRYDLGRNYRFGAV